MRICRLIFARALSGFLIYGIAFRKQSTYWKFLLRRVQRLFPAFLVVLGIYLCLSFLFPQESKIPHAPGQAVAYVLSNIAMLPGIFRIVPIITVAWSLSYEFCFYLSIPLLISGFGMRRWKAPQRTVFFLLLAVGYVLLCVWSIGHHPRLILFGAGIILWELTHGTSFASKLPARGEVIAILCFSANLALIGIYGIRTMDTQLVLSNVRWWYSVGLFITVFWLSSYALQFDGYLKTFFCWNPMRWMGNMSYSYYLIHGVALKGLRLIAKQLFSSPPYSSALFVCMLPIGLVVTLAASSLLFLLVEKPFSFAAKKANAL